jgi:hypothetical protein
MTTVYQHPKAVAMTARLPCCAGRQLREERIKKHRLTTRSCACSSLPAVSAAALSAAATA